MEKYVVVKHTPESKKLYWFFVPEELSKLVSVGSKVRCKTKRGIASGRVVCVVEGMPINNIRELVKIDRLRLSPIIGVYANFPIKNIQIPVEYKQNLPNPLKLRKRTCEFLQNKAFDTHISITHEGILKDGFSAYLVAKYFGCKTLSAFCFLTTQDGEEVK